MTVHILTADEIDPGLQDAWVRFQAGNPDLRSPFFSPEFCRIVAGVRPDLRIAVVPGDAGPEAIFPFHMQRFGRLAPLAGPISDYHGIIGPPAAGRAIGAILRAAGAQAFDFNHAPASQTVFAHNAFLTTSSPLVNLSDGFESWRQARRAEVRALRDVERRGRKLAREVGPLRFVANDRSDEVWQAVLDWKRAALAAMGVRFILDRGWAREVVETIRATDTPDFGGITAALWAGDTLAAVHFGMRTSTTAHWWFPSYNAALGRYSPGLMLLMESLRHAADTGITEFDFGRGGERYKGEFANSSRALCEGSVERALTPLGAARRLRKAGQATLARTGASTLTDLTRRAGNRLLAAGRLS